MARVQPSIAKTCWSADVYEPSDDTFALVDALWEEYGGATSAALPSTILEIGSGSGYVLCSLALCFGDARPKPWITGTDINARAASAAKSTLHAHEINWVDIINTDVVGGLLPRLARHVDLLVFNPPYVPTPASEVGSSGIRAAWAGGDRGRQVIDRVLPTALELLSDRGTFFMVTVHENDPQEIMRMMEAEGLEGRIALTRGADEERLHILRFQRCASE